MSADIKQKEGILFTSISVSFSNAEGHAVSRMTLAYEEDLPRTAACCPDRSFRLTSSKTSCFYQIITCNISARNGYFPVVSPVR